MGSIPATAPFSEQHYTPASLAAGGGIIDSELPGSSTAAPPQGASSRRPENSDHHTAFGIGILPLLGAGAESGAVVTEGAWKETLALLSAERGILEFFQSYRRNVHAFHAIPIDLDDIEQKLCLLLGFQDSRGNADEAVPARDPNWLCLLNAILAAGAQASEMPLARRISMSRTHSEH